MSLNNINPDILNLPIPSFEAKRKQKTTNGYADISLNHDHPLFNDPVVKLSAYDVRCQSYYANNSWLGEGSGFEAAMRDVYVRQDIAERLQRINAFLGSTTADFIHEALGGRVDIFVTDGLRPVALIEELYHRLVPDSIRRDHPELSEAEVMRWRDHRMAKPDSNAPHSTGGAIDIALSYPATNQKVPNGFERDNMETMIPEYLEILELSQPLSPEQRLAQLNRRILYYLMTSASSERGGADFVNNGLELWHFGTGDKLSGLIGDRDAYYDQVAELPE
ncbi:hypothetical protein KC878_00990 [Candidatus Saccharibacteria bacterium]|nr:hypothetical protein [Candidatus Saccharibacteria bacterium]MCB9821181.1 hypothetical protein [Candidatus Nomurabacteria bacterium]